MELFKWVKIEIYKYISLNKDIKLHRWFKSYNFKALEPKDPSKIYLNTHLCVNNILDFKEIEEFTKLIISKEDERCRFAYSTLISIYLISGEKENILKAIEVFCFLFKICFEIKNSDGGQIV